MKWALVLLGLITVSVAADAQSVGGMSGVGGGLGLGGGNSGPACGAIQADFSDVTGCNAALLAGMLLL